MVSSRARRIRTDAVIAVVGMMVILALVIVTLDHWRPSQPVHGPHIVSPMGILIGTVGTTALVIWWSYWGFRIIRAMDEYQQHIELASWFWGGLIGLIVSVPVYVFVMFGGLQWLNLRGPAGPGVASAFAEGYMLPIIMQVVGATAFALWHRLAKR